MDLTDRVSTLKFVLRDRDSRFSRALDAVFAADDIRTLTSPPPAPRANAICERMIANTAPRTARQDPDRQRTPPTPDPDGLPPSLQHRAATPHTRATRPGPSRNPAPTRDQPRRPPGSPQTNPWRAHQRVSPHRMTKPDTTNLQAKHRILYSSPTGWGVVPARSRCAQRNTTANSRPWLSVLLTNGQEVVAVPLSRPRCWR
jgi:hypothetical protein